MRQGGDVDHHQPTGRRQVPGRHENLKEVRPLRLRHQGRGPPLDSISEPEELEWTSPPSLLKAGTAPECADTSEAESSVASRRRSPSSRANCTGDGGGGEHRPLLREAGREAAGLRGEVPMVRNRGGEAGGGGDGALPRRPNEFGEAMVEDSPSWKRTGENRGKELVGRGGGVRARPRGKGQWGVAHQ